MSLKHWTTYLESDMPIKRHFDEPTHLNPLFLIQCSYHDFTLTLRFASFTTPLRRSQKWSNEDDAGTEIELVGHCCQFFHIEGMNLDVESSIQASDCEVDAVQCVEGICIDIKSTGVQLTITQDSTTVLTTRLDLLQLTRLSPINENYANQIRQGN